jgi:hypothetical protein
MSLPLFDSDVLVFLATCVRVISATPERVRRQPRRIPADYLLQEAEPEQFTEKQREFFAPYDEKLAAMNYFPVCSYRVVNYGRTLIRRYASPIDPAYCTVMAAEVKYHYQGQERWAPTSQMAFRSDFTSGRSLTTRNMKIKTILDRPPEHDVQECPNVNEPAALKKKHDTRAAKMGVAQSAANDASRIFEAVRAEHKRFSEYQVERGTYTREGDGGYVVSGKAHWRAVRNHYNPFAQRISPGRLSLAALAATGIPALTYLRIAPTLARALAGSTLGLPIASEIVLGASYIVAGAAIGLLLKRSVFMWAFLLSYVGVHLCTGWWFSAIPFSSLAASAAYSVKALRQQQGLMLQSKPTS